MESVVQQKEGSANANDGTDSESNSYDKNDDMSEDELTVLGGSDRVTIVESDDDGGGRKRGKKRRRGVKIKLKQKESTGRHPKFGMSLMHCRCQIHMRKGRCYQRQGAGTARMIMLTHQGQQQRHCRGI
jgi:hypothetical protein